MRPHLPPRLGPCARALSRVWVALALGHAASVLADSAGTATGRCTTASNGQSRPVAGLSLDHLIHELSDHYQAAIVTLVGDTCLALSPVRLKRTIDRSPTLPNALQLLLQGSDLQMRATEVGVIVTRIEHPLAPASDNAPIAELVVTGQRERAPDRLALKYQSNGVTDTLLPEQLKAFANRNTAEALDRVAGVSINRDGSEGRQVSLRGMSPDFTRIELNGMEILNTGTTIDSRGALNRSRSFDFNAFALGDLQQASVVKTASADLGEGGIAGTIKLVTPRPLDLAGEHRLRAQLRYNDAADGLRPGLSALWATNFDEGRQGLLLSVEQTRNEGLEHGFSTVRWISGGWNLEHVDSAVPDSIRERLNSEGSDALFRSRYNRYDLLDRDTRKTAINAAWQYQSDEHLSLMLNAFWGRHALALEERHLDSAGLGAADISDIVTHDLVVDGNDIVYGRFSNVTLHSELNLERDQTDFRQLTASASLPLRADWALQATLGHSDASFHSPRHDKVWFESVGRDFSYDYRGHDRVAVNHYGFDLSDPAQWQLYRVATRSDEVDNRYNQARLQGNWQPASVDGHGQQLSIGLDLRQFHHDGGTLSVDDYARRGEAITSLYTLTRFPGAGLAGTSRQWVSPGRNAVAMLATDEPQDEDDTIYAISEGTWGAFAQWGQSWREAGHALRLDAGLRYAATAARSHGIASLGDTDSPSSGHSRYDNWLPSMNFTATLSPEWLLRFSAGQNITRPTISDLRPNVEIDADEQTITLGNPALRPFHATAVDLAMERYAANGRGLASAGLFYKNISHYITEDVYDLANDQLDELISADLLAALRAQQGEGGDVVYSVSRPRNGGEVQLWGIELSLLQPLHLTPERFGYSQLEINYAYADAAGHYLIDGSLSRKPLLGLSRHTGSLSLEQVLERWQLRLSASYRSRYLTEAPAANGNDEAGFNPSLYLDLAADFQVNARATLKLAVLNLTNEPLDQYVDHADRAYSHTLSGRDYTLQLICNW